jgi:WD40 repeat protein
LEVALFAVLARSIFMNNEHDINIFPISVRTTCGEYIRSASFSHCGRFLALLRESELAIIFDVATKQVLKRIKAKFVRSLAFHPRWAEFTLGYADGNDRAERVNLRLPDYKVQLPFMRTTALAYSANGRYLGAGDSQGFVSIIDLDREPRPREIFYRHVAKGGIAALAISEEPPLVVAVPAGSIPVEFSLSTQEQYFRLRQDLGGDNSWDCISIALSADGNNIALGGNNGKVYVKNFHHGQARLFETNLESVRQLEFLPDNNKLAVVGSKAIEVWETWPRRLYFRWNAPKGARILAVRHIQEDLEGKMCDQVVVALERRR